MHELTHLDLFSGIGGFKLAAEQAGFRTVAFSEVEPYACYVLAERWPTIPNIGDVRVRSNFARFRGTTVLSAGYPCQPESYAGKRRGKEDHRWLWPAARGVIDETRPTWFIGENVFGHVTLGLDSVLADLECDGYSAQPFVIPACAVDARHRRDRVWIIAHNDRERGGIQSKHSKLKEEANAKHDGLQRDAADDDCNDRKTSRQNQNKERSTNVTIASTSKEIRTNTNPSGFEKLNASGLAARPAPFTGHDDARWREWCPQPRMGGVVYGIPPRSHESGIIVARLTGLGNAIIPQIAEAFLRWIAQIEINFVSETTTNQKKENHG